MPQEYLAMKASLKRRGKSDKEAKRIAAATYNKRHPNREPVTSSYGLKRREK